MNFCHNYAKDLSIRRLLLIIIIDYSTSFRVIVAFYFTEVQARDSFTSKTSKENHNYRE